MLKNILKIVVIFVIGTVGGVFADQILWPYFIERPLFYEYRLENIPVNLTKQVVIQENTALQDAFSKTEKMVIGIRTSSKGITATQVLEGNGVILTSDGLAVTLAEFIPQVNSVNVCFVDSGQVSFQALKVDRKQNLALIKIESQNLTVPGFADFNGLRYGERVFFVASFFDKGNPKKMIGEGIIKIFDAKSIQTSIFEPKSIQGSPVFDIEGNIVGLALQDKDGMVSAIPISKIREFAGL